MNLQCSGRACCLFAVWLSVAVLSLYNFFILFFVYINRIVSNNFYCNSLPKGQRRWLVVGKLEHTRKEPFSCAAENSSFSKLFRFIFNVLLFCSVFVILIILTCYFCVLSVSVCVCGCVVCLCLFLGKIDYDIKKQQFLGEENIFLINTSTVYNNICFTMLNFHQNTKVHKHYIDFVLFTHHHRLYIFVCMSLSWCLRLNRVEKEDYRDHFHSFASFFIWKLLLFFVWLVWIYASLILALCKLQRKLTTWNTCFCVCVSH